jgi:quercetin dioxygenase-like cupin family protein
MRQPTIIRGDEQPQYQDVDGVIATVLVDNETTDARNLALGHISFGAERSVPPHTREVEEFIYVLDGQTTILCCGNEYVLGPGDAIYIPPGTEHQHTNPHKSTLKQLFIFSPPGPEAGMRRWPTA